MKQDENIWGDVFQSGDRTETQWRQIAAQRFDEGRYEAAIAAALIALATRSTFS